MSPISLIIYVLITLALTFIFMALLGVVIVALIGSLLALDEEQKKIVMAVVAIIAAIVIFAFITGLMRH